MERTLTHAFAASVTLLLSFAANAQTLSYDWLNFPCDQNLNCDTGCSACNTPAASTGVLFGTSVSWNGLDVCPHPISIADNAVYSVGWPAEADAQVFIGLAAIATEALKVDSIVVRHRRAPDGPRRLRASFTNNVAEVPEVIGETDVNQVFEESVFTDLGCLAENPNSPLRGLQLRLQGLNGEGGDLQIDALRIVTSPCATVGVGIGEIPTISTNASGPLFDILGRSITAQPEPGFYVGGRRQVRVL